MNCRSSKVTHKNKNLSQKARFYKSFRGFFFTLFVLFSAGIIVDNDFFEIFRMVGFFWGVSLVVKYFKLKGLPGTNGWLSDDWFDWILNRYPKSTSGDTTKEFPGEPGEDYDPLWKDKDLV